MEWNVRHTLDALTVLQTPDLHLSEQMYSVATLAFEGRGGFVQDSRVVRPQALSDKLSSVQETSLKTAPF